MNEDEWFTETDYTRHIRFVETRLSVRKGRLLAAAFCRTVLHVYSESPLHRAVETAEEFADGAMFANRQLMLIHKAVEAAEEFADGNSTSQELERCRQQCRKTAIRANEEKVQLAEVKPDESLKWGLLSDLAWIASFTTTTTSPVPVENVGQNAAGIAIQTRIGYSGGAEFQFATIPATHDNLTVVQNREFRALVWEVVGNPFSPVRFQTDWRTSTAIALARGIYQSRDFTAMPILADALQDAGCDNDEVLDHCRGPGTHVRGCWLLDQILELL